MKIIKRIINELKNEWKKNKLVTGFMAAVVVLAILTYLKPSSTSGILNYIGLSIINFIILAAIVVGIWWFYVRKRK